MTNLRYEPLSTREMSENGGRQVAMAAVLDNIGKLSNFCFFQCLHMLTWMQVPEIFTCSEDIF